jgi:micrococcal nuclease
MPQPSRRKRTPLPPGVDCADVPYRGFTVLQPDPHRFDGDYDGIGCER